MAEKKRYPETLIELEAMKEVEQSLSSAADISMITGIVSEIFQEDIGGGKLNARIIVSGTFEFRREVDKRDPWWVD